MTESGTPADLDGAGLDLWRELDAALDFLPHERVLAIELCRAVSLCEQLNRALAAGGLVVDGQRGPRVSPLAAELRQQRLVVARLTASLGIPPLPDEQGHPRPRGAARGVYRVRGVQ